MFSSYIFFIRKRDGSYSAPLQDIESADIIETLNEPGSWTLKSRTKTACPFEAGDGLVVSRNGLLYYSGILKEIEEEYDGYTELYTWTVKGASDLEFLSRRVCYPDPATGATDSVAYYTDSGTLAAVVKKLIDKNLGVSAMVARQEPLVDATAIDDTGENVSVSLRFQTLSEAIKPLLDAQNFSIRANWDDDTHKIIFQIYESADLSDSILFSTKINSILSIDRTEKIPDGNYIISGGKGEETARAFAYAYDNDSITEWGRVEFFHDMRSTDSADLQDDADSMLREYAEENSGYSAEMNSNAFHLQYKQDWNLGDFVSVAVGNGTAVQRILQVETKLNYDTETISPAVGFIKKGQLAKIFGNLKKIRSDVNQLQWVSN